MQTTINYQKYENMNKKALFNSLLNAEKSRELLVKKVLEQDELIEYLKVKTQKKIDEIECTYTPNKETIKAIEESEKKDGGKSYTDFKELWQELRG